MNTNSNVKSQRYPVHYWRGVIAYVDAIRDRYRDDPEFTSDMKHRLKYIETVVCDAQMRGQSNPAMMLPRRYTVQDIEAVLGISDNWSPESGSDGAWRAARKRFDMSQSGRGGRTV